MNQNIRFKNLFDKVFVTLWSSTIEAQELSNDGQFHQSLFL